jgi:type II secretory pathway pseudopilin PulG
MKTIHRTHRRAITMLELLTVVSIVSVLAAISVPNFLEAQVRSKVSRTHVDMAAVTLAMRAYRADHGTFPPLPEPLEQSLQLLATLPPGQTSTQTLLVDPSQHDRRTELLFGYQTHLTTPVAYLGAIPVDTFVSRQNNWAPVPPRTVPHMPLGLMHLTTVPGTVRTAAYGFEPGIITWSSGPALQIKSWNLANGGWLPYDPTNGTVSGGILVQLDGRPPMQTPAMADTDPPPPPSRYGNDFFM